MTTPLIKNVSFYALPQAEAPRFTPKSIYYFKIGLKRGRVGPHIFDVVFKKRYDFPTDIATSGAGYSLSARSIDAFNNLVNKIVGPPPENPMDIEASRAARLTTPLDFHFEDQCFILIELDRKYKNWCFDLGFLGVTAKADYGMKNGDITYLKAVGDHLEIFDLDPYAFDTHGDRTDCCAVMFGVFARADNDAGHRLNLHTTITYGRDSNGKPIQLPTIFDPDIKNDGGGFPPPPGGGGGDGGGGGG